VNASFKFRLSCSSRKARNQRSKGKNDDSFEEWLPGMFRLREKGVHVLSVVLIFLPGYRENFMPSVLETREL
jgi:hypothetical protein